MNSTTSMLGLAALVIVGLIGVAVVKDRLPSKYDGFAQCIQDNGGRVYTASWCPNCEAQLAMFGSAARNLNNKECSIPGGPNDLELCKGDDITAVPTWEKADGERFSGVTSLETLAETFGCELPQ